MSAVPSPQVGPSDDVPLSIEPVLGWRVWNLVRQGGQLRLGAIAHRTTWTPQEATKAGCARTSHAAPQRYCTCGYYATSSVDALASAGVFNRGIGVIGAVAMWGTVIEHARGARAEFAYPARLRLVCSLCLQGGSIVDPVTVVEDTSLIPLCDRHSRSHGDGHLPASAVQAELLATYGVELLPRPKLRGLRVASRNVTPMNVVKWSVLGIFYLIRFLISALFVLWMLGAALAIIGVVLSAVWGAVTGETSASASPSVIVSVTPTVPATSYRVVEPHRGKPPPPRMPALAAPCGIADGGHVELARCLAPGVNVLGISQRSRPKGQARDCMGKVDAYTRGHGWWICWIALPGAWIEPHPDSPNPYRAPKALGGVF
jgi:hypothetical protein